MSRDTVDPGSVLACDSKGREMLGGFESPLGLVLVSAVVAADAVVANVAVVAVVVAAAATAAAAAVILAVSAPTDDNEESGPVGCLAPPSL